MQYRFNRFYLFDLLSYAKGQYKSGAISKKEYELLKTIIEELIRGKVMNNKKNNKYSIDDIKLKLERLKDELGMDLIEKLFYLSGAIIKKGAYYALSKDQSNQSSGELVQEVLQFYNQYNEDEFNYLNEFAHGPLAQLEIIPANISRQIKNRFANNISTLPFYDIDFIRIVRRSRLYDEACLCHEFRHALDVQNINNNSLDLNVLSEMNPIGMELYYGMTKMKENKRYRAGIQERLNDLSCVAYHLRNYLSVLMIYNKTNNLTEKLIMEVLDLKDEDDLQSVLSDLESDCGYELISYFIGTLNGIKLCNIAIEDKKESINIQNRVCSIMVSDTFIPKNLEDVLGREFTIREGDIKTYKEFIKKLR